MMEVVKNPDKGDFYHSQLARFHSAMANNGHSWTGALREAAFSRFSELGLPTTKHEEWKYTNVGPIAQIPFIPAEFARVGLERLAPSGLAWLAENRLVCVNGHFSAELSFLEKLPRQVKVGSLREALIREREFVATHLGRYASFEDHTFVALNTAFMQDGAFLHFPKGTTIEKPIHLIFIATGNGPPHGFVSEKSHCLGRKQPGHDSRELRGVRAKCLLYKRRDRDRSGTKRRAGPHQARAREPGGISIASLQVHQGRSTHFSRTWFPPEVPWFATR